jgi:hypothetical protein
MHVPSKAPENGEAIALRSDDEHLALALQVPAPRSEAS